MGYIIRCISGDPLWVEECEGLISGKDGYQDSLKFFFHQAEDPYFSL